MCTDKRPMPKLASTADQLGELEARMDADSCDVFPRLEFLDSLRTIEHLVKEVRGPDDTLRGSILGRLVDLAGWMASEIPEKYQIIGRDEPTGLGHQIVSTEQRWGLSIDPSRLRVVDETDGQD